MYVGVVLRLSASLLPHQIIHNAVVNNLISNVDLSPDVDKDGNPVPGTVRYFGALLHESKLGHIPRVGVEFDVCDDEKIGKNSGIIGGQV